MQTLPCIEPEDLLFVDASEAARALSEELRAQGAEVVVAEAPAKATVMTAAATAGVKRQQSTSNGS